MGWLFTGGLPETPCGIGSTLETTGHIRERLPSILYNLGVMTLLDAPCGDFNWMKDTDLAGIDYIGCDIDHLKTARMNGDESNAHRVRFLEMDIVHGHLPRADAIICRDFLQHLPNTMVFETLRNFFRSGAEWMLMTSHSNEVNVDIGRPGMFRPLNLLAPPFDLPAPAMTVDDPPGSGRIIGVWSRSGIC